MLRGLLDITHSAAMSPPGRGELHEPTNSGAVPRSWEREGIASPITLGTHAAAARGDGGGAKSR